MAARRSAATPLRAVKPGEKPTPRTAPRTTTRAATRTKIKTVSEAAASGSTLDLLVALRSRIATSVQDPATPARDLAALTRRLQDIVKEIEAIKLRDAEEAERDTAAIDGDFDASAV